MNTPDTDTPQPPAEAPAKGVGSGDRLGQLPVKIARTCYCCSKCGVVIAYEEQPCPLCAARKDVFELRAINLRLHEQINAYEDQWVDENI